MRLFLKLVCGVVFLLWSMNADAQDVQKLPDDPRIKTGKLANGLTYYIIKNAAAKGYADFCITQKVGTSLEEKEQYGMFKALEMLALRGTRNFTDSTITQYLRSVGVGNDDILFRTGKDDITYLIRNIPVRNPNTVDSALLILYNWSGSINIDEEDITNIMPALRNRLMDDWNASSRLDAAILREVFPGSPYANTPELSKIGKMEPYSSKDLRNFYYKWFRPDLQAVVIVGDIDPAALETQVKSVFSTIPKPLGGADRAYYDPPKFDGVKVVIRKDPEYNKTTVTIHLLKKPLPSGYKTTSVPYIEDYMDQAISTLLFNRIQDGIISRNLPISDVKIEQGKFMDMHQPGQFSITFQTQPGMVYAAIAYLSLELDRMAKYGFNNQEFINSREIYFRNLETLYDNRFRLGNGIFLKRALDNYLGDYSLASIEMRFEIMKEILFALNPEQLNEYANAMLGQKDNIIITCKMPQVADGEELSKERMLSSFTDALAKSPSSYLEAGVVKWPKYYTDAQPASVTSEITDPVTGAYVVILSNGATALLKKTDTSKDTVFFKGISKGGFSLMKGITLGNEKYLNEILNLGGLGDIPQPTLEKLFAYHNLSLKAEMSPNTEQIYGYAGGDNVEKLFQMIHLSLTARRADEKAFNVYKRGKVYDAMYQSLSPESVFMDSVLYYNNSNKKYVTPHSPRELNAMEYSPVLYSSRARFSNAADFVFIFAGNMDKGRFTELAVKYLGSIPGDISGKENWEVAPNYFTKGNVERRFLHQMVIPRTYVDVTLSCGMPYSIENFVLSQVFNVFLEKFYINGQIKDLAAKSRVTTKLLYYPEDIMVSESRFETDSAGAAGIVEIMDAGLDHVARSGIDPGVLEGLMKEVRSNFNKISGGNRYWLETLERRYMVGKDFHSPFLKVLEEVDTAAFREFVRRLKQQGNRVVVIMEGTTEDVKTRNLFRENKFIRDYFEL